MNQSQELLENLSFCVIDLETTGGSHSRDQIIEIGMVHIDKMQVGETKNFLINPKREIPEFIQRLTNITMDTIKDAPEIKTVIDEIIEFIGDRILVAHNSGFDVPFLNSVLKRLHKDELSNKVICTNIMTKHLIPEIMSSNLSYMSSIFNIDHQKAHRAIEDAIATAHLLIRYMKSFKKRSISKVNQLYYPRNRFEIDRLKIDREEEDSINRIKNIIENTNTNLLIIIKGSQGVFKSIIPYDFHKKESSLVFKHLETLDWQVVTLKQIGPLLDGLLFLNTHLYKLSEVVRDEVLTLLSNQSVSSENKIIDKIDFLVTPHLIKGQFIVYNFLNFNSNSRTIFRYPGHEKKIVQQLRSQVNRFTNNQKKRRKVHIYPEILSIMNMDINDLIQDNSAAMISIKDIQTDTVDFKKIWNSLSKSNLLKSSFPLDHI